MGSEESEIQAPVVYDYVHEPFRQGMSTRSTMCFAYDAKDFETWREQQKAVRQLIEDHPQLGIDSNTVRVEKPTPLAMATSVCDMNIRRTMVMTNKKLPEVSTDGNLFWRTVYKDGQPVRVPKLNKRGEVMWRYRPADTFSKAKGRAFARLEVDKILNKRWGQAIAKKLAESNTNVKDLVEFNKVVADNKDLLGR